MLPSGRSWSFGRSVAWGVRAALVWNADTARLAREHNDANVISLGARQHELDTATEFVRLFLETPYSKEPRHTRRIEMLARYESTGEIPRD